MSSATQQLGSSELTQVDSSAAVKLSQILLVAKCKALSALEAEFCAAIRSDSLLPSKVEQRK